MALYLTVPREKGIRAGITHCMVTLGSPWVVTVEGLLTYLLVHFSSEVTAEDVLTALKDMLDEGLLGKIRQPVGELYILTPAGIFPKPGGVAEAAAFRVANMKAKQMLAEKKREPKKKAAAAVESPRKKVEAPKVDIDRQKMDGVRASFREVFGCEPDVSFTESKDNKTGRTRWSASCSVHNQDSRFYGYTHTTCFYASKSYADRRCLIDMIEHCNGGEETVSSGEEEDA